ncbi:MAG: flagellar basal body-associated FliL family protein [Pseudomonadales bacterium]|nr:flagellar basal body-associated FliL family protein [Pseudomonadales bacterium]
MMKIVSYILLLLATPMLFAEDGGSAAMYIKITPGLVVNYGEPSSGRLRYLKVSVHVRVKDMSDAEIVEHHLPALQDVLISILSAQDVENIRSAEGKEEIRKNTLAEFQQLIEKEEGESVIQDLLFGSFIVQR